MFVEALSNVYGLGKGVAEFFTDGALNEFGILDDTQKKVLPDLAILNTPNRLEHDASLTRKDHALALESGNLEIDPALVLDVLDTSKDGRSLTIADFASLRVARVAESKRKSPTTFIPNWTIKGKLAALGEAALLLIVFGDGKRVSVESMREVLMYEKLPEGYVFPLSRIGVPKLAKVMAKIRWRMIGKCW